MFSAVYEYNESAGVMQKMDIEGSIYLLLRSVKPYYKIFVLNRKSRDDFSDYLTEATEFSD